MDLEKNIHKLRNDFPILKYKNYLNTSGRGPTLSNVWNAVHNWWKFRMSEDRGAKTPDVRGEAAKILHADKEEICLVNRISQGLNMVSSMMSIEKDENIIVTDLAFPSNVYVWSPFIRKGTKILRVRNQNGLIETADFENTINDSTRIVCLSHVEWTSGLKYDVKAISKLAHDHNAILVDDAYQAIGAMDLDVHNEDVDFLIFGSQKYLCCPSFTGIFYIRRDLIDKFEPSYQLYESVEDDIYYTAPWEKPEHDNIDTYNKPLVRTAQKFYRGCVSDETIWGFHAALRYFNDLGIKKIEKRVKNLSGYLIEGLNDLGIKVMTPQDSEKRSNMVIYTTGKYSRDLESYRALQRNNIIVSIRYSAGIGGIRVGPHFFNTIEEIDELLKVQRDLFT